MYYNEPNLSEVLYKRIWEYCFPENGFWDYYNQYELSGDNKLIFNSDLCYDLYYKKYANILWEDISKIINEVFEK